MTKDNWKLVERGHAATLCLDRASDRNSLTEGCFIELQEKIAYLRSRDDIWSIVLEGAGEHFSVGVDVSLLASMVERTLADYRDRLGFLQGCLDSLASIEKPTIAKIRGFCIGGGFLTALCCDFRIAATDAKFGFPEVKRSMGIIMGAQRIVRTAGMAAAKEMSLLGDTFDTTQAKAWNLIHRAVAADTLDETVQAWVEKLHRRPPRAVGVNKRILDSGAALTHQESLNLEAQAQADLLMTDDFKEAMASFFEKRMPHFKGR